MNLKPDYPTVIFIDIDETICYYPGNESDHRDEDGHFQYYGAVPITANIKKVNDLYDQGYRIVYWTARGAVSKIDWAEFTVKQLKEWGVKYHEVRLDKPYYDYFIDDKGINARTFDNMEIGDIKKLQIKFNP